MNWNTSIFGTVRYLATFATCLALVPFASAQSGTRMIGDPQIIQPQQFSDSSQRPPMSPMAQRSNRFVPQHLRSSNVKLASYPGNSTNGQMMSDETYIDGGTIIGGESVIGGCEGCGVAGCADCGGCEVGCDDFIGYGNGCDPCGYSRMPSLISFSDMEYFGGVQGFKGPVNLGQSGSFGFNYGINWGFPLPIFTGLGLSGQLGFRFTHVNGSGAQFTNAFTDDTREQFFVTGAVFRRVDYGLQYGVAYDYLNEDWYYKGTYGQIRGEISWVGAYGNQLGFRYTTQMEEEPGIGPTAQGLVPSVGAFNTFVPLEQYRFFYEQKFAQTNTVIDVFGGFTGQSQGLLGADVWVPITERFLIKTTTTILIDDGNAAEANIDEGWNVGVNLVFYPKGWTPWNRAYHRPMMDVADNGTFLLGRQ